MKYDFFISHCSEDKLGVAFPLYWSLNALGFNVWIDRKGIVTGQQIYETIECALKDSDCVIAVIAEPYLTRAWTIIELEMALDMEKDHPSELGMIFPIYHGLSLKQVTDAFPFLDNRAYEILESPKFTPSGEPEQAILNRIVQWYFAKRCCETNEDYSWLAQHRKRPHIEPLMQLIAECFKHSAVTRLALVSYTNAIRYIVAILEYESFGDNYDHNAKIARNYCEILNNCCFSFECVLTQEMLLACKAILQTMLESLKLFLDSI